MRLPLAGRPLLAYPAAALAEVVREVVIVAKVCTELPELPGVVVWIEPDEPVHPAAGITHALTRAGEGRVAVCAGDLPFVSAALIGELCRAGGRDERPVLAAHGDVIQPLLGVYPPSSLPALKAGIAAGAPMRRIVEELEPVTVEVGDETLLFNVNTPEDCERAQAILARSSRT
jgi:molybdopterin-guanine dinucleotide biosynthesis protein A